MYEIVFSIQSLLIWYIGGHSFSISCFLFSFKLLSNVFSFILNCCLFFWIFFDSFLSFCLFVSIVFSWCIVPCTLLIYDPIWLLILFRLLFKISWFLKMFEIGFRYNLFLISGTCVFSFLIWCFLFFNYIVLTFYISAVICFWFFGSFSIIWLPCEYCCLVLYSAMHPSDSWSDLNTDF